MRRAERKSDRKRAATAELTAYADLAAMPLDQLLHQREPDAAALEGASARAIDAAEALEQVRQLSGRDALRKSLASPVAWPIAAWFRRID